MKKSENSTEILADLLFAYVNKDEDLPHHFEVDSVERAVDYLKINYVGKKYNAEWFEGILVELKEKAPF